MEKKPFIVLILAFFLVVFTIFLEFGDMKKDVAPLVSPEQTSVESSAQETLEPSFLEPLNEPSDSQFSTIETSEINQSETSLDDLSSDMALPTESEPMTTVVDPEYVADETIPQETTAEELVPSVEVEQPTALVTGEND